MDGLAETLVMALSPNAPFIRLCLLGPGGQSESEYDRDSDIIEYFSCPDSMQCRFVRQSERL
jgi:hypothetical protein